MNNMNDSVTISAIYVLAGMTLGLALGMLLAPSSGSEARQYIAAGFRILKRAPKILGV